jgi:hypothetical protein
MMLAGDTASAEEQFLIADGIEYEDTLDDDHPGRHLHGRGGSWWAEFLARTTRVEQARTLVSRNRTLCAENGWNQDVARCDRLIGSLELAAGKADIGKKRLLDASNVFREADLLVDLAETLPIIARCEMALYNMEEADQRIDEALALAAPRGLLLSHCTALAVRANIQAEFASGGSGSHLQKARDAADAAHRLSARHSLPWQKLEAYDAHALLDDLEGVDGGWSSKAAVLRARLTPADLDPHPLETVERPILHQRQAERQ